MSQRTYLARSSVSPVSALPRRGYAHQLNSEFLVQKEGLKARLIDGVKIASTVHSEIAAQVKTLVEQGERLVRCWLF